MQDPRSVLPMKGIRVLDLSWVFSGPWCAELLGCMGAEVIKVESRKRLDICRMMSAAFDGINGVNRTFFYNIFNVSKKSCTLNLATPEGVDLTRQLIEMSDIAIENFGVGLMERIGLGDSVLARINPKLIMVHVSGYGQTGPLKSYACYGNNVHAYSGLTSLLGYLDGVPRPMGGTYADPLTGLTAGLAVLAALNQRARTGLGQVIDVSMCEGVLAQLPEAVMDYTLNGKVTKPRANRDDVMAPHGVYRCLGNDKWVAIAVFGDEQWRALCKVMGKPALAGDAAFSDGFSRWQNQERLDGLIESWTAKLSHYDVMRACQDAGVPAGPSLGADELFTDPQLKERRFWVDIDHPELGRVPLAGAMPWKMSGVPSPAYEHAPLLGEHNDYVFRDLLGMSQADVARLSERQVIY